MSGTGKSGSISRILGTFILVAFMAVIAPNQAAAIYNEYYVNPMAAPMGNGSEGAPWMTLTEALTYLSGNGSGDCRLNVAAGEYKVLTQGGLETDTPHNLGQGPWSSLIIQGASITGTVINGAGASNWYNGLGMDSVVYVTVRDLTIKNFQNMGAGSGLALTYANYCAVENCEIAYNDRGIYLQDGGGHEIRDNCYIHNNLSFGINMETSGPNVIRECSIENNGQPDIPGTAIMIHGSNNAASQIYNNNIVLLDDLAYPQLGGISIDGSAHNDEIFHNSIHAWSTVSATLGIIVKNCSPVIDSNFFMDLATGVEVVAESSNNASPTIVNNLFRGEGANQGHAITWNNYSGGMTSYGYIQHNTMFQGAQNGVTIWGLTGNIDVKYNIIQGFLGSGIYVNTPISGTLYIDYNDVYDNTANYSGCTAGPNDISTDPMFVAEGDFNLQGSSPCVNAIPSTVGDWVDHDHNGQFRPTYGSYDMGAFEYFEVLPGTHYYVDANASAGGDGQQATPWLSLHGAFAWLNANATGDVVLHVAAGTYAASAQGGYESDAELIVEDNAGQISSITIQGEGASSTIINGSGAITWTVGLEIRADNVSIFDMQVQDFSNAVWGRGFLFTGAHYGLVERCNAYSNNVGIEFDGCMYGKVRDNCAIGMNKLEGVKIINSGYCEVYGNLGSGISSNGDTGLPGVGVRIQNSDYGPNKVYNNIISSAGASHPQEAGVHVAASPYADEVFENQISGTTSVANCKGVWVEDSSPMILRNTIKDCYYGIRVITSGSSGSASPEIVNNVIYGMATANQYNAISISNENGGESYVNIFHNTLSTGSGDGIYVSTLRGGVTANYNIIEQFSSYAVNASSVITGAVHVDYNCTYMNNQDYYSCDDGGHNYYSYPNFVGTGDYHLNNGSVCIDSIPPAAGDPIGDDKDGVARPQGVAWDVGAYEYQAPLPSYYYVDPAVSTGGAGTEGDPWGSLDEALQWLIAYGTGDVELHLAAGEYKTVSQGGNEPDSPHTITSSPVTSLLIQGAGPVSTTISGGGCVSWTLGLDIQAGNVTVQGLTVSDFSDNGIRMQGAYNCLVENVQVRNNYVGIELNNSMDGEVTQCEVYNNVAGIVLTNCSNIDIHDNWKGIYDNGDTTPIGLGVFIQGSGSLPNKVRANAIYYSGSPSHIQKIGLGVVETSHADDISGNVITSSATVTATIGMDVEGASPFISGNIIFDNAGGIVVQNRSTMGAAPTIENNVIASVNGGPYGLEHGILLINSGSSYVTPIIQHNTLFGGTGSGIVGGSLSFDLLTANYNIIQNFDEYGISIETCISCTSQINYNSVADNVMGQYSGVPTWGPLNISDPQVFVDAPSGDYRLLSGSSGIDYIIPAAGDTVATDLRGVFRPENGFWDIGAYELDITPPLNPEVSFTDPITGVCALSNTVEIGWVPGSDMGGSGIAGYYWLVDAYALTDPTMVTSTFSAELPLTYTLASGVNHLHVMAQDFDGNVATATLHLGPWTYDDMAPSPPELVSSSVATFTCTISTTTSLSWNPGYDPCGINGYYWYVDSNPTGAPTAADTWGMNPPSTLSLSPGMNYLHIVSEDSAGALSAPLHIGPWMVDGSLPVNPVLDSTSAPTNTCTLAATSTLSWTEGSDDCELTGYWWSLDDQPFANPVGAGTFAVIPPSVITFTHAQNYLHVIAVDRVGNQAPMVLDAGPWLKDSGPPTNPMLMAPSVPTGTCTISGSVALSWSPGTDDCAVDGYWWSVTSSPTSSPVISGNYGPLPASISLNPGENYLHVRAKDFVGALATEILHIGPWTKDSSPPANPALLLADVVTGTCVVTSSVNLSWSPGSDDCAMDGYWWVVDNLPGTDPVDGFYGIPPSNIVLSGGENWLHVRAKDQAGNVAASILHLGPWRLDTQPPDNPRLAATTVPTGTCTISATTELSWTPGADDCGLDGYWISTNSLAVDDPVSGGTFVTGLPPSISLLPGDTYLHVVAQDSAGQYAITPLHIGPWTQDTGPPSNPELSSVSVATNTCTISSTVELYWFMPGVDDCGAVQYRWNIDANPTTDPGSVVTAVVGSLPVSVTLGPAVNYLHLVAMDDFGANPAVLHIGPWLLDDHAPGNPTLDATSTPTGVCTVSSASVLTWTQGVDDCAIAGYWWKISDQAVDDPTGAGAFDPAPPAMVYFDPGANYLHIVSEDDTGKTASEVLTIGPWKLDSGPPSNPLLGSVSVVTDACVVTSTVDFTWSLPGSDDCGAVSYRWSIDDDPYTDPGSVVTAVVEASLPISITLDGGLNYLHLVAQDDFGPNPVIMHIGPWRLDVNDPENPVLLASSVTTNTCTTASSANLSWSPGTDDCQLDGYWWMVDSSPMGNPLGTGDYGVAPSSITLNPGANYLHIIAQDATGKVNGAILDIGPWLVDAAPPVNPSLMTTSVMTNTCTTSGSTNLTWTEGSDDCQLYGYWWKVSSDPLADPTDGGSLGALPASITFSPGDNYLRVRAKDATGALASGVLTIGPWKKDAAPPVNPILLTTSVMTNTCTTSGSTNLTWTEGSDDCQLYGYWWKVSSDPLADPTDGGSLGALPGSITFSPGDNYLRVQAKDATGALASGVLTIGPWKKDAALPVNPVLLTTSVMTNTCTAAASTGLTWTPGSDDCELYGYWWKVSGSASDDPTDGGTLDTVLPATAGLSAGDNYLHVQAKDVLGALAGTVLTIGPWKKDAALPDNPVLVDASVPTNVCTISDTITLGWTPGSDDCELYGYWWKVSGSASDDPTDGGTLDTVLPATAGLSAGDNYLHVQAKDVLGALAGTVLTIGPWKKDAAPPVNPVLMTTSVMTNTCTTSGSTNLTWTEGSDDCHLEGYWWKVSSDPLADPTDGGSLGALPGLLPLSAGDNYLLIRAKDGVGNLASNVLTLGPWKKDDAPPVNPVLQTTSVMTNTCVKSSSTNLTWTEGSDDCHLEGYWWKVSADPYADPTDGGVFGPLPASVTLPPGDSYLLVQAEDQAGNAAASVLTIGPWKQDVNAPVNPLLLDITVPTNSCTNADSATLTWSEGSDDCQLDGYWWLVDSAASTNPSVGGILGALPITVTLGAGDTYLHVLAKDVAGNQAAEVLTIGPWKKDGAPPENPVLTTNTVATGTCTKASSTSLGWFPGSDDCQLDWYWTKVSGLPVDDPTDEGSYGVLPGEVILAAGDTYLHVQSKDAAGNLAAEVLTIGPWKRDTQLPENPALVSTTVVTGYCTQERVSYLSWTPGSDDCMVYGYYHKVSSDPMDDPSVGGLFGSLPTDISLQDGDNYLLLQAKDAVGNRADDILVIGPWTVDAATPVNPVLEYATVLTTGCTLSATVGLVWAAPGSDDCGLMGYAWVVDQAPDTDPMLVAPEISGSMPVSFTLEAITNYFHIVALDEVGQAASQVLHLGPWTACQDNFGPLLMDWAMDPFGLSFRLEDDTEVVTSTIQVQVETASGGVMDVTNDIVASGSVITNVTVTYTPAIPWPAGTVVTTTVYCEDGAENPIQPNPVVMVDAVRGPQTHEVYDGESIQAALDNATSGDAVYVHGGLYTLTQPLVIGPRHSGIHLQGEGPMDSLIYCDGAGMVLQDVSGFQMSGFGLTITVNGVMLDVGGVSENVLVEGNIFVFEHDARTPLVSITATGAGNRFVNNLLGSDQNGGVGFYVEGSGVEPEIVNNTLSGMINGIDVYEYAMPKVAYNIIAFNSEGIYSHSTFEIYYNCVYGNGADYDSTITHLTDINQNPMFLDPPNGDFHLSPYSSCVDALDGTVAGATGLALPDVDLDGMPRPEGGLYDIGCYETTFVDSTPPWAENWQTDTDNPASPISVHLRDDVGVVTDSVAILLEADTLTSTLFIEAAGLSIDDSVITDVVATYTPDMPWPAGSMVTATLSVEDLSGLVGTDVFTFTVRGNRTLDVYPGQSIQDALDQSTAGDSIVVNGGVYTFTQPLDITQRHSGIYLMGQGPDATTLVFAGTGDGGILVDGARDFTLSGFNLTTNNGQGILMLAGESEYVLVDGNRFVQTDNEASGAIYVQAYGPGNRIVNNLLEEKYRTSTGIYVWTDPVDFYNGKLAAPEIVNNTLYNYRTGIYISDSEPSIAYNVIASCMWGISRNTGNGDLEVYYNNVWGSSTADYYGPLNHPDDINSDPGFVAPGEGDYRLQDSSPAVDSLSASVAGDTGVAFPAQDFAGNNRPAGDKYDMGCYETAAPFEFASTPDSGVNEDSLFGYDPAVTGGTVVSYTFAVNSGHPAGMTLDAPTGRIDYAPLTDADAGIYNIIIEAHAADGRTASQAFTLTVTAVNDPPDMPASVEPMPYHAMENRLFSLEFYSYDEETPLLNYSLQSGPTGMAIPDSAQGILEYVPPVDGPKPISFAVKASDGVYQVSSGVLTATVSGMLTLQPMQASPAILVTQVIDPPSTVTTTVEINCQISGGTPPYTAAVLDDEIGAIDRLNAATGAFAFTPLQSGSTRVRITDTQGFTFTSGVFDVRYVEATLLAGGTEINAGSAGVLTVNEPDSDLNGLVFSIPANSTTQDITPTVSQVATGAPFLGEGVSPVVEIGPSGTTFAIPASLAFPNASAYSSSDLLVFTYDAEQGRWVYVPGAVVAGNVITVPLAHLSMYALAYPSDFALPLPGGVEVEDYRMVSFPAYAADKDSIVQILESSGNLEAYDDTKWRLFGFDPLAQWSGDPDSYYVEGSEAGFDAKFPFGPCQAYWLISRYAKSVEAPGLAVDEAADYYTTLQPGWNMLGNPFAQDLYWNYVESSLDGETFYRQDIASTENPLKGRKLYAYDPENRKAGADGYVETLLMEVNGGYWIKNATGQPVILKIPVLSFVSNYRRGETSAGDDGWLAGLARRVSRMVEQVAFAATGDDRPPAPPGVNGANQGSAKSIGKSTSEGGGGGSCFVESASQTHNGGAAKAALLPLLLGSLVFVIAAFRSRHAA